MISDYRRYLHVTCSTKKDKHKYRGASQAQWKQTKSKMIEMNGVKNQG